MKELRVGMIGYGFMGRTHSNAYKRLTDFFPVQHQPVLKAVCARDPEKAKAFAENWGYERIESDWRKVVEAPDIDLIDIGSPNDTQKKLRSRQRRNGKMICCEKPLAMKWRKAKRWSQPWRSAGVPNMVWFNYRRVPSIALAKQLVDEGRIGQAFHYRATYLQDWTISPDVPQGGAGLWRLDVNVAGSGVTGDLLAHSIDTAMWLNGADHAGSRQDGDVRQGTKSRGNGEVQPVGIDDACMFLAEFANGSMGTFESTRYARGRKNYNTFELNGADGSVFFDLEEPEYLQFFEYTQQQSGKKTESHLTGWRKIHTTNSEHPYMNRYWVPGTTIGYEHTFLNALADFVMGIESGNPTSPISGMRCRHRRVCDAVLESARTGKWMETGVE